MERAGVVGARSSARCVSVRVCFVCVCVCVSVRMCVFVCVDIELSVLTHV